jgi:hypothetical protein
MRPDPTLIRAEDFARTRPRRVGETGEADMTLVGRRGLTALVSVLALLVSVIDEAMGASSAARTTTVESVRSISCDLTLKPRPGKPGLRRQRRTTA